MDLCFKTDTTVERLSISIYYIENTEVVFLVSHIINCLKFHGVGLVRVLQRESGLQPRSHHRVSNIFGQSSVDGGLGGLSGGGDGGAVLLGGADLLLGGLGVSGEKLVIDLAGINTLKVNLGGGGNDVTLVHAAERDTVGGVGACEGTNKHGRQW
jgi:hypothetical protein